MKTKILLLAFVYISGQAENNKSTLPINPVVNNTMTKSLVSQATNTAWVDQKVEEIKPQRSGLNNSSLATLKSPFIIIKPEPKKGSGSGTHVTKPGTDQADLAPTVKDMSKEPLTLQIVLNSSALINGTWLKEGDQFRGYKLTQISSNNVVLERKNKKIKLFIAQQNDNINISTK